MLQIFYVDGSVQTMSNFHHTFQATPTNVSDLVHDTARGIPVRNYTFDAKGIERSSTTGDKNKVVANQKSKPQTKRK